MAWHGDGSDADAARPGAIVAGATTHPQSSRLRVCAHTPLACGGCWRSGGAAGAQAPISTRHQLMTHRHQALLRTRSFEGGGTPERARSISKYLDSDGRGAGTRIVSAQGYKPVASGCQPIRDKPEHDRYARAPAASAGRTAPRIRRQGRLTLGLSGLRQWRMQHGSLRVQL